jgi:hypothetical protein
MGGRLGDAIRSLNVRVGNLKLEDRRGSATDADE